MNVGRYAKFIVAAVFAGVQALNVAIGDDLFDSTEAVTVVLAVLTALGVYGVKNT
jgi:hypothetical protein